MRPKIQNKKRFLKRVSTETAVLLYIAMTMQLFLFNNRLVEAAASRQQQNIRNEIQSILYSRRSPSNISS